MTCFFFHTPFCPARFSLRYSIQLIIFFLSFSFLPSSKQATNKKKKILGIDKRLLLRLFDLYLFSFSNMKIKIPWEEIEFAIFSTGSFLFLFFFFFIYFIFVAGRFQSHSDANNLEPLLSLTIGNFCCAPSTKFKIQIKKKNETISTLIHIPSRSNDEFS